MSSLSVIQVYILSLYDEISLYLTHYFTAKVLGDLRSLSVIQVSTLSLSITCLLISPSLFHSLSNSSSVRGDFVLVKELLRFLEFRYLLSLFVLLVFLSHAP